MKNFDIDMSEHDFKFKRKWFKNRNLQTFVEYIYLKWAGKPILYLEIGVFEGMSLTWMFQHILTHPESRAVGIDPWLPMPPKWNMEQIIGIREHALHNLSMRDRLELIHANSVTILDVMLRKKGYAGVSRGSLDLCMVDGDHHALGMLADAKMCLPLMRKGGWLLFDDVELSMPRKDQVKEGLRMFVEQHGNEVKRVFKHKHMEAYEVL
ncbi:hypothetical protein LCGC14_0249550 [marine sediment metagenome]|uniref:Class I SAM-dependent methyltransferase n=1 Tax=marine sediment metagenome TaxID=412755 RepID=A0A0F9ULR5_9ZZZZ